jgi:hypothetical protein
MPTTFTPEGDAIASSIDDDIVYGPTPSWLQAAPTAAQNWLACAITSYRSALERAAASASPTPSPPTITVMETTMRTTTLTASGSLTTMTERPVTNDAAHTTATPNITKSSSALGSGTKVLIGVCVPLAFIAIIAGVAVFLVGKSKGRAKGTNVVAKGVCSHNYVEGNIGAIAGATIVETRGNRSPVELPVARYCVHCP